MEQEQKKKIRNLCELNTFELNNVNKKIGRQVRGKRERERGGSRKVGTSTRIRT